MNRYNIKAIYIYSHDQRRRDIAFDIGSVNIITGVSNSGKSALAEIIDYTLGASQCHIPGIVRETSSWVAVLWTNGDTEVLSARKVPPPNQQSSEDSVLEVGAKVDVPLQASGFKRSTNRSGALRMMEQAIGIGAVTSGSLFSDKKGKRISLRNSVPLLLQSDEVIINKKTLLRGSDDEQRQSIIDTLPYFLGIADERLYLVVSELKRLYIQREREERRLALARRQSDEVLAIQKSLLSEASEVGLISKPSRGEGVEDDSSLRRMLEDAILTPPSSLLGESHDAVLADISRQESNLRSRIYQIKSELRASEEMMQSATDFEATTSSQERRHEVVQLIASDADVDLCPVCHQSLQEKSETVASIERAYEEIRGELRQMQGRRPQLDQRIEHLRQQHDELVAEHKRVRDELLSAVRVSDFLSEQVDLQARQQRVIGRISYYLENREVASTSVEESELARLNEVIETLDAQVDQDATEDRRRSVHLQISRFASDILTRLPFDQHYREALVDFDTKNLRVGLAQGDRYIPMRDVGSDENYLSLHVSVMLALHRILSARRRPVPAVLLFDQPSRPFYPPDKITDEIQLSGDQERERLKRYFDEFFREADRNEGLQIIVLEHAYFADDPRYVEATKLRLTEDLKLIPEDWPRII